MLGSQLRHRPRGEDGTDQAPQPGVIRRLQVQQRPPFRLGPAWPAAVDVRLSELRGGVAVPVIAAQPAITERAHGRQRTGSAGGHPLGG